MRWFLSLVAAVLAIGCSPNIKSGVVIEKRHEPAETTMELMPIVTPYGDSTIIQFMPTPVHRGARWLVTIEAKSPDGMSLRRQEKSVTEQAYGRSEIGAFVTFDH